MAISWGAWEYSGGNGMRVGIDVTWSAFNGTDVTHNTETAKAVVEIYTENQFSYGDSQTLSFSGAIGGSVNFYNGSGGAVVLRETKIFTYVYGPNEYGSSPGERTFTAKLSGAFNGITPSKSVTSKIPARPYASPATPSNATVSRINDGSQKITWRNHATSGEPYDRLQVDRSIGGAAYITVSSPGGSATSYTDSGTRSNEFYQYRVRAENSAGLSGFDHTSVIHTTPAAPSNASRSGANGANQVVTWNNNVGYTGYETQVWHAADGVWDSSPIATVGSGVTTYTHSAPDPAKTHKYRLRTRMVTTGDTLYSSYSNETSETSGATSMPNPASNLSPNGTTIVPTQTKRFTWTFNSTDGTPQYLYRIRHRQAGTSTWTNEPDVYTSNAYWDAPAGKFANDSTYEWQVATWADNGEAGIWSGTAFFYTATDPSQIRQNKRPVILNTDTGEMETAGRGVLPPVGSMMSFAGDTAPSGWLLCDGRQVLQSEYPDLFAVIGSKFGSASTGYFRLPDLRDRAAVGASTSKPAGTSGGSSTASIGVTNLPPHYHGMNHDHGTTSHDGAHSHTYTWKESANAFGPQNNIAATGGAAGTVVTKTSAGTGGSEHSHNLPTYVGNTGNGSAEGANGTPVNVQNPYVAMHQIIKT